MNEPTSDIADQLKKEEEEFATTREQLSDALAKQQQLASSAQEELKRMTEDAKRIIYSKEARIALLKELAEALPPESATAG